MQKPAIKDAWQGRRIDIKMIRCPAAMQRRALAIGAHVQDGSRGFNTLQPLHQIAINVELLHPVEDKISLFVRPNRANRLTVQSPSLARSMAVPPAVPATVSRISSMKSTFPSVRNCGDGPAQNVENIKPDDRDVKAAHLMLSIYATYKNAVPNAQSGGNAEDNHDDHHHFHQRPECDALAAERHEVERQRADDNGDAANGKQRQRIGLKDHQDRDNAKPDDGALNQFGLKILSCRPQHLLVFGEDMGCTRAGNGCGS